MLWVSADPGCGKSVLAKYLVDSVLPTTKSRTMCYFFFKDDFEDQRNLVSALYCVLHQLFMQKPILLSDAILDQFDTSGETITNSFGELWQILLNASEDENAGEIICLLDAIDECEDQGRSQLAQKLCQLYGTKKNFNLKFLLTSRPYGEIRRGFQRLEIPELPVIHLSGESDVEMEKISREIDVFIRARVQEVGARLRLTRDEHDLLLRQLMRVPHRTYLWAHLTLDLIENDIDIEKSGIVKATSQLPQTVDEAYDRILSKSRNSEKAKKILHIILAAARPLTLSEMALALVLQESHRSYYDLNPRSKDRFHEEVRDVCGLFVTVIDSKIYLLHHTAKEFLVQDDSVDSPKGMYRDLKWKHSFRPRESHRILTQVCIWYLLLAEFETHPLSEDESLSQYVDGYIFLDYSAKHWVSHFHELQIEIQNTMTQTILKICDTSSRSCLTWFRIYWTSTNTDFSRGFTTLMITSYFGLSTAVKHLLKVENIDLSSQDHRFGRSALSWAAGNGFDAVVRRLINVVSIGPMCLKLPFRKGAEVDSVDRYGRTPLLYAVRNGNLAVVKRLIKAGARVDSKDDIGGTPLSYAITDGREEVFELLFKGGIQVDLEQDIGKKLLLSASRKGHEVVIRLLLETGKVNADSKDNEGHTPLSWAARMGDEAVVKLLLETGKVDAESKDCGGQTPLSWAARRGNESVVKLLLETGKVDANSKDYGGHTPLSWAARMGDEAVVKLLLETGKVDAESKDDEGETPLSFAAQRGDEAVVKLLLKMGKVNANLKDDDGQTPLSWAARRGDKAVVQLLLETGKVDVDSKDNKGQSPLSWAARRGDKAVVQLLLETGKINANSNDNKGQTPLFLAAQRGDEAVVKLLLKTGKVDPNSKDNKGQTPLSWAARRGDEAVVKLLLKTGKVNADSKDNNGQTPLSWAARRGDEAIVKLLLKTGKVNADSKDNNGQTPLLWAALRGNEAVVKLLLETGKVDANSKDDYGQTPLSLAAQNGHMAVVKLLPPLR
jgi:ankyrin repeat protein